jgi:hypothetical protein
MLQQALIETRHLIIVPAEGIFFGGFRKFVATPVKNGVEFFS